MSNALKVTTEIVIGDFEMCWIPKKTFICDPLRDLVPFVQFKKREKHPWRSANTPPWVFFRFLKLYKWYQIAQWITYTATVRNAALSIRFCKITFGDSKPNL